MAKKRLDQLLCDKELCESTQKAQALIMTGDVIVNNEKITKSGTMVSGDADIYLKNQEKKKYVSRGGLKLEGALDQLKLDVSGAIAMDIGVSTGGFTDCILQRGAEMVIGIDVGYGQVDYRVQTEERVVLMERCNARHVSLKQVEKALEKAKKPKEWAKKIDLVLMDLSFISVEKVLPNIVQFCVSGALFVVLIKPQFESNKDEIGPGGIIEKSLGRKIVDRCITNLSHHKFMCDDIVPSVIKGAKKGNQEYWVTLKVV